MPEYGVLHLIIKELIDLNSIEGRHPLTSSS